MKYRIAPAVVRGKKMWVIDVPATATEKRKRIFHATKWQAEQEARDLYGELEDFPLELRNFTRRERSFLRRWLDQMSIEQMEDALTAAAAKRKQSEVTVAKAIEEYLSAPRERKLSDRHIQDLESRLGIFSKQFGSKKLAELNRGELEDYIRSKGGSAPNHYRVLRGLFFFAVRRDWIDANPVKLVHAPVVIREDKDALTPEQMRLALRISMGVETLERYEPMLRLLVGGGLCGLRHSEVMRLDCAQIDTGRGEIHVTKMKTAAKGIRERYVAVPENAKEWLLWLKLPESGPYIATTERNLRRHRDELVDAMKRDGAAKLDEWPHNVLRRSFGSYHLAAFQNAALTAELMGHTDAETTKSKYRVARRKEIADQWFALTPSSVLT